MSLTLYFHPLASYCRKAVIALYENDTPFTRHLVDLGDPAERAALKKLWGVGKFPVLRDEARNETVPESSIIVEYLAAIIAGPPALIPEIPAAPGRRGFWTASSISMCICRWRRS